MATGVMRNSRARDAGSNPALSTIVHTAWEFPGLFEPACQIHYRMAVLATHEPTPEFGCIGSSVEERSPCGGESALVRVQPGAPTFH